MNQILPEVMAEELAIAQHLALRERVNMESVPRESFLYRDSHSALRFYEGMEHAIRQIEIWTGWKVDTDRLEQRRRELEGNK